MTSRVSHTSFDSLDAYAMSVFWGGVLGFGQDPDDPNEPGDEECMIFSPDGSQRLLFIEVADAKTVKNRLHLDLEPVQGSREAELERLLALGARQAADRRRPDGSGWVVLADPEGNELCILRHRAERAGATPLAQQHLASQVLVDLSVLIASADEDGIARAVRASVAAAAPAAALDPVRWGAASGGEDLVRQWSIEQGGAPLDGRRVRRLTMGVHAQDAPDLLEEIVWAAIDAICPTAREENRRLDAGEPPVPASPDEHPWSSATRIADGGPLVPLDAGERETPAIHVADERTTLTAMLDWYRQGVQLKVEGMDQAAATTSALASGTTAAGLVKHLALVEDSWFTDRLAGRGDPEPWASAPFDDDPDWEFHSANHEPLVASVDLYRAACQRSRAVTAGLDLDDTAVDEKGRTISLRFVLVHLVEETARHLGHLDVLRELADGRTGE